jgi:hypothetical protein
MSSSRRPAHGSVASTPATSKSYPESASPSTPGIVEDLRKRFPDFRRASTENGLAPQ